MEMTMERALEFLRMHQPMPADDAVSKAELEELDLVRRFLTKHPNQEAVGLLLGVFGDGDGFGVYQLIEGAVAAHDSAVVVPALASKLEHGPRSVRYWCALISANHPDERLVPSLAASLRPEDCDLRYAAVTALEAIGSDAARAALRGWLPKETDDELREVIEEACV